MVDIHIGDIAFAAAIGFLAGILAVSFGWPLLIVVAAFVAGGVFAFIAIHKKIFLYGAIFACLAVLLGTYYFYFFTDVRSAAAHFPSAADGSFSVIVSEEPAASEKYLFFTAELQPPYAGKITIFAPPGSDIRYGDLLDMSGAIAPPTSRGDSPAAFPKQIDVVSGDNGFWLTERLLDLKNAINKEFAEFLPQDEAALLGGMTVGGTAGMSPALKSEMAASETLYATSMYGYKIAMIVAAIETLLASWVPRRARFCIAVCATMLFVAMAGGNISAMRGGIMACLVIFAKETGSLFSKRNALALTAAGMALFDPTIASTAGFLFSFASVAGMALLTEPFRNFLRLGEGRGIGRWKEAVLLSVSSLVPIIPLVSAMFGSFSLTAIFANVLIAPTIPLGMAAGVALAAAGFVSPYIAFFVAHAAGIILDYALWVVHFFAAHVVPLPISFSGALPFVLYYGVVGLFAHAYRGDGKS